MLTRSNFESYGTTNDLWKRWDNVYQVSDTAITTGANVFAGLHAGSNTKAETTKYDDNVVVAKSCVGPMAK